MTTSQQGPGPINTRVQRRLERELGPMRFERYFERHTRLAFDNGSLRVSVPSAFHADWLDRRFGRDVRAALSAEAGVAAEVRWDVDPSAFEQAVDDVLAPTTTPSASESAQPPVQSHASASSPSASPPHAPHPPHAVRRDAPAKKLRAGGANRLRHTLDAFIVGPASRLAHRAAIQIAEVEQSPISVLFLHGPCGVGKTHLLQGIAQRFRESRPWARVRYVSGEAFANQYIASLHAGNIDSFRERYRGVDLLCIDDVHFLGGKVKTQSEFLHTFEALDLDGARVVLASDGHPKQIENLHEGIVSRCLSGMVVRLDRPDRATRVAIVRTLLAKRGLSGDDACIEEIASMITGSVRELEGAVKRVEAYARLLPTEGAGPERVTVALVRRALGSVSRSVRSRPLRLEEVLDASCAEMGVTRDEVLSSSRHKRVVLARGLVGLVARAMTSHSYPEIAKVIGRKNHSTVITACKRLEKQIREHVGMSLSPGAAETPVADVFDRVKTRLSADSA